MKIRVTSMYSRKGRKVPNQFLITDEKGNEYFQSYRVIVAAKEGNKIYLDETYYNYSRTTARYRNEFLQEDSKTINKKIKSGEYILTNLNK